MENSKVALIQSDQLQEMTKVKETIKPDSQLSVETSHNKWLHFNEDNGVWGFDLTKVTIILVVAIQISFVIMLYTSCSKGYNVCTWEKIPMISDVIQESLYINPYYQTRINLIANPMFDRIFIIMNTAYFVGIHQVNVRALYSCFHGVISPRVNAIALWAGLASSFSLPLIGLFDNKSYGPMHNLCALVFFLSSGFYLSLKAYLMHKHREVLIIGPHSYGIERRIIFNYRYSQICTIIIVVLFASVGAFGPSYWTTAFLEWLCVFCYMTLTMLIMSAIPSYDQLDLKANNSIRTNDRYQIIAY